MYDENWLIPANALNSARENGYQGMKTDFQRDLCQTNRIMVDLARPRQFSHASQSVREASPDVFGLLGISIY